MKLKDLIKKRGVKLKWLAAEIGVSVVALRSWCKGTNYPSVKYIPLLADKLDATIEEVTRALING